ncbi:MAG: VOC family protein [Bdellovibrionales bacterium]
MASIRYLVDDVDTAVKFYAEQLGFELEEQFGPAMAIVRKNDLTLWLAGPMSSAAKPMADGRKLHAGGWNRFVLQVENLHEMVADLKKSGVKFLNEITQGPGGSQTLCQDPSGNAIELFQPAGFN